MLRVSVAQCNDEPGEGGPICLTTASTVQNQESRYRLGRTIDGLQSADRVGDPSLLG
jgi:hypothetical protein